MENLQFILHENFDIGGEQEKRIASTLGFKFTFEGKQYGDYIVINKPTVTSRDIMEALEELCPKIEQVLKSI